MVKDVKGRNTRQARQGAQADPPTRIAIACQGGGIHAAFAVGVLTEILTDLDNVKDRKKHIELAGISGTSAGALCALMVWYGLAKKNGKDGSPRESIDRLNRFWDSFAAVSAAEKLLNFAAYSSFKVRELETPILGLAAPVFSLNPRSAITQAVMAALPHLGVRRQYFDLGDLLEKTCPEFDSVEWDRLQTRLLVGATDALNGIETVFDSQCNMSEDEQSERKGEIDLPDRIWRQRHRMCLKGVAASGTLPELRAAERIDDRCYWDGLYSLNPPIREFWEGVKKVYLPTEIWVIRINPQQTKHEPQSHAEIEDRQNELMGNLALNKELDFIAHMNMLLKDRRRFHGMLDPYYQEVTIRTIKMTPDTCAELRYATKFNRSARLIDRLRREGRRVARDWLDHWQDDKVDCYPDDVGHWRP